MWRWRVRTPSCSGHCRTGGPAAAPRPEDRRCPATAAAAASSEHPLPSKSARRPSACRAKSERLVNWIRLQQLL